MLRDALSRHAFLKDDADCAFIPMRSSDFSLDFFSFWTFPHYGFSKEVRSFFSIFYTVYPHDHVIPNGPMPVLPEVRDDGFHKVKEVSVRL